MKANSAKPDPRDPQWDANDPLWRLLGESARPEPDAWFATRTLARCRKMSSMAEEKVSATISNLWRWALGGGLAVCLAIFLVVPRVSPSQPAPASSQAKVQEAFAIMASIDSSDSDSDSSSSSSSSWQDPSSL
jgi:hypothetical protein